ncbi:MAG: lactate racemase domain-containing protein [Lachnospiraceae bacterium]|nr:lactate racemase domain-containing protein [Lachnospiraceae bacterium]
MPLFPESAYQQKLPQMHKVLQQFDETKLEDVEGTVRAQMHKKEISSRIKPGMRVAMAVGSRGIQNMALIAKTVAEELKNLGADPFIVPAMGSHGGGTAEGQAAILAGYGITEETMGVPVISSLEVDELGTVECASGTVHVVIDHNANSADMIVPLGRVKPHTDFRGPIESGLCKMLTIGLGKFEGCTRLHHMGAVNFPTLLPDAARLVIEKAPVGFGVAIIENSYDQTYHIETVPADKIHSREPELLKIARSRMSSIMLKEIDALVVQELGKDISGAGMDPNIIGRAARGRLKDFDGPEIQRIFVTGLTESTHGNASGIGLADYVLKSCADSIDLGATATNSVSCGNPEGGRIPIQVQSIKEGVLACLRSGVGVDFDAPKIVYIKNTLQLGEIWVSDALLEEVKKNPNMTLCEECLDIEAVHIV